MELGRVPGLGQATIARFREAGIHDVQALANLDGDALVRVPGIEADLVRHYAVLARQTMELIRRGSLQA